ncbi:MAG TPA: DUF459 domain-containing protein [Acidimicrobiales bacterium]|jgi:lysophospholipase L1-like esterase|nr:DUF459 domain-containing protein [Acidimicrobiales bacterium]
MSDFSTPTRQRRSRHGDAPTSALRAGVVLLCAFGLWLVMDATVLQHNATVQAPLGARRTAALDVLDPLSELARALGLDLPVGWSNVALDRTADGGFTYPTVPPTTKPVGPTTTTTIIRNPTRAHPLRVLLIGDSIGEDLDAPLLSDLTATGVISVNTFGKVSTGLTRLDYFNWIEELIGLVYEDRPNIIIGMMGANDSQSFVRPELRYGSTAWRAKYIQNAGQLFSIGKADGRKMFWVSVPAIQNPGLNKEWNLVRNLQQKAASQHHVLYIDSDLTLAPNGHYAAYLNVGGQLTLVRTPSDGIHLTPAGGALLAQAVMIAFKRDLGLRHLHW